MRYEFERGGRTVASAVWEGPAQVTIEVADPADRPTFDRYFGEEVVYLDAGIDFGGGLDDTGLTTRRRDWTPWEFERHVRNLAQKIGASVRRVETGPVEERTRGVRGTQEARANARASAHRETEAATR